MHEVRKKIILIGSVGVGKTSLIRRFVHQEFTDEYHSTIGVRVDKKTITLDDTKVHLMIWDLAGEILQNKAYQAYLKGSSGIIGIFDVTRPASYQLINESLQNVKGSQELLSIMVGNKIDLLDETTDIHGYDCEYFTSAKTGENVEEMFNLIAQKLVKKDEKFKRI